MLGTDASKVLRDIACQCNGNDRIELNRGGYVAHAVSRVFSTKDSDNIKRFNDALERLYESGKIELTKGSIVYTKV